MIWLTRMNFILMTMSGRFNGKGDIMDPTELRIELAMREIALLNEDLRNAWNTIDLLREEIAQMKEDDENGKD
jgi:RecB family exonuclease